MNTTLYYDASNFIADGNRIGNFVGKSDIFQNLRFSCQNFQISPRYRLIDTSVLAILQIWNEYHKTFQIVDYTMTNIQNIRLTKIVDGVPASTPDNPIRNLYISKWNPNNINILNLVRYLDFICKQLTVSFIQEACFCHRPVWFWGIRFFCPHGSWSFSLGTTIIRHIFRRRV